MTRAHGVTPMPQSASPALRSSVDITAEVTHAAEVAAAVASHEGPMGELWAGYTEWGQLLQAWQLGTFVGPVEEFEELCREQLDHAVLLGRGIDEHAATVFTANLARFSARYHHNSEGR
ncbi:hypothetical protein ACVDFE_02230 [Lentzea chajnantorensis]